MGTMLTTKLLQGIWDGTISVLPGGKQGPVADALTRIVSVPTVSLACRMSLGGVRLLPESTELLPGASLGDVLVEELGIEVPYGAIVVLEDASAAASGEVDAGRLRMLIERALLDVVLPADGRRAPAGPAAAERLVFRDHGLNTRFFPGLAQDASPGGQGPGLEQRAAG
jgi:hypothetical protein